MAHHPPRTRRTAKTKKLLHGAFLVLGEGKGFRTLFDQIGSSPFGEAAPQAQLNPTLSASVELSQANKDLHVWTS